MKKITAKSIAKCMNADQGHVYHAKRDMLLYHLLNRGVVMDETWINHYNLENEEQFKQ